MANLSEVAMADAPKPATDAAKVPAGAGAMKKIPGDDAGDDGKAKKIALKPLPTTGRHIGRGLIAASVILAVAWVVADRTGNRYQLVPVQTQDNTFMYRIDTLSGDVHFCTTQQCIELPIRAGQ